LAADKRRLRSRRAEDLRRELELVTKWPEHYLEVRWTRGGKEISHAKHVVFGWVDRKRIYLFDHLHESSGILERIIEGGYRTKSLLWGAAVTVPVVGINIPVGLLFPLMESVALGDAIQAGNLPNALYWAFALFGPFGDVLAIKAVVDSIAPGLVKALLGGDISLQPPNPSAFCGNLKSLFDQHVSSGNLALARQVWDKARAISCGWVSTTARP
jgi:hypothetical protein